MYLNEEQEPPVSRSPERLPRGDRLQDVAAAAAVAGEIHAPPLQSHLPRPPGGEEAVVDDEAPLVRDRSSDVPHRHILPAARWGRTPQASRTRSCV